MADQEFMAQFEAMKKDELLEYVKHTIGSDYQPTIRQMSSKGKIHQNWKSKPLLLQDLAAFFGLGSYVPAEKTKAKALKAKPVAKNTKAKAPKAKTPTYSTTSSTISRQIKSQKKLLGSLKKRPLPALRDIARLQGIPFTNSTSREDLAINIVMHRAMLPGYHGTSTSSNNTASSASSGRTVSKSTVSTATSGSKRPASKTSSGASNKKRAKPARTW